MKRWDMFEQGKEIKNYLDLQNALIAHTAPITLTLNGCSISLAQDDYEGIVELSEKIEDYLDLQRFLLLFTKACFCQHAYSSSSRIDRAGNIQIMSSLKRETVEACLKNLAGRLNNRDGKHVTPSRIWKKIRALKQSKRFDALIVGASKDLADSLSQSRQYLVLESDHEISGDKFQNDQEVDTLSISPQEIFKESVSTTPDREFNKNFVPKADYPADLIEDLHFLAEDHLCGNTPISFISIPIGYYTSSFSKERDILAIEIVWVSKNGKPFAIDLPKSLIDSLVKVCLKSGSDIVHKLVDIYHTCDYGNMIRNLRIDRNPKLQKTLDIVLRGGTKEKMISVCNKEIGISIETAIGYISEIAKLLKEYVDTSEDFNDPHFVKYELEDNYLLSYSLEDQEILKKDRMKKREQAKKKTAQNKEKSNLTNKPAKRINEEINPERLHFALIELFPPIS